MIIDILTSLQDCILSWVAATAGCHLDWFSAAPGNFSRVCSVKEDITKYIFLILFLVLIILYAGITRP